MTAVLDFSAIGFSKSKTAVIIIYLIKHPFYARIKKLYLMR